METEEDIPDHIDWDLRCFYQDFDACGMLRQDLTTYAAPTAGVYENCIESAGVEDLKLHLDAPANSDSVSLGAIGGFTCFEMRHEDETPGVSVNGWPEADDRGFTVLMKKIGGVLVDLEDFEWVVSTDNEGKF